MWNTDGHQKTLRSMFIATKNLYKSSKKQIWQLFYNYFFYLNFLNSTMIYFDNSVSI